MSPKQPTRRDFLKAGLLGGGGLYALGAMNPFARLAMAEEQAAEAFTLSVAEGLVHHKLVLTDSLNRTGL